jgi:hypothetical protein
MVRRFCSGCGNPVQPEESFCANCGTATSSPPPQEVLQPGPEAAMSSCQVGPDVAVSQFFDPTTPMTRPAQPHHYVEQHPPIQADNRPGWSRHYLFIFLFIGLLVVVVLIGLWLHNRVPTSNSPGNHTGTANTAPEQLSPPTTSYSDGINAGEPHRGSSPLAGDEAPSAQLGLHPGASTEQAEKQPIQAVPEQYRQGAYCSQEALTLQCPAARPAPARKHGFSNKELDAMQKEITRLNKSEKYSKAICRAREIMTWTMFSDLQLGRIHYEVARAFKGMGCQPKACESIGASLRIRPADGKGFDVTCKTCFEWQCTNCEPCIR